MRDSLQIGNQMKVNLILSSSHFSASVIIQLARLKHLSSWTRALQLIICGSRHSSSRLSGTASKYVNVLARLEGETSKFSTSSSNTGFARFSVHMSSNSSLTSSDDALKISTLLFRGTAVCSSASAWFTTAIDGDCGMGAEYDRSNEEALIGLLVGFGLDGVFVFNGLNGILRVDFFRFSTWSPQR